MRSNTAHICSHKGPIRSKTEHIKTKNEHYCAVLITNIPNTNTWNIPWCWTQMFIYWTPTSKLEHIFWTLVVKRIHSVQNLLQFMCSNSEHFFLECTQYFCTKVRYREGLITKKYKVLKGERQLRLTCGSYAQVIAVTIKHTLHLRPMTYFLLWK